MRRDYYTLEVRNVGEPADGEADEAERPVLAIDVDGPFDALKGRLSGPDGSLLDAADIDVSYRLRGDAGGVLSLANRVTGEYLLEVDQSPDETVDFVRAARRYGEAAGDDASYEVRLHRDGDRVVSYRKRTLLVYDSEGDIRREDSLIPGGVEL